MLLPTFPLIDMRRGSCMTPDWRCSNRTSELFSTIETAISTYKVMNGSNEDQNDEEIIEPNDLTLQAELKAKL